MPAHAAGPGEPGLDLAQLLPHSTVTCTDYAQGMVDLAAKRSKELGLTNTRCSRIHWAGAAVHLACYALMYIHAPASPHGLLHS